MIICNRHSAQLFSREKNHIPTHRGHCINASFVLTSCSTSTRRLKRMAGAEVRQLLSRVLPSAREQLLKLATEQRSTFWADTELKLRVRKYPKAGGGE